MTEHVADMPIEIREDEIPSLMRAAIAQGVGRAAAVIQRLSESIVPDENPSYFRGVLDALESVRQEERVAGNDIMTVSECDA